MPGKVPNVFVMPNTMPEKEPAISFILIKGPAPQKNPLKQTKIFKFTI